MEKQQVDSYLHSASYLIPGREKPKSTKGAISKLNDDEKTVMGAELLVRCELFWTALQDFRDRRARARKYERGDQWFEKIKNDDDEWVTEEDLILSQNRLALKQNVIRQLVKNLLGQYRASPAKSVVNSRTKEDASLSEMMTNALQAAKDLNQTTELDAQQFHEHILSGMMVGKVGFKHFKELDRNDVLIDNINVNRMFFNTDVMDIRTRDLNLIGEIIDTDMDVLISTFARSEGDEEWIKEEYSAERGYNTINQNAMTADATDAVNFYYPEEGKYRLFEVWYLRSEWMLWVHDFADGTYKFYPLEYEEILKQKMTNRVGQAAINGIPEEEVVGMEIKKRDEQFWYVKYLTPSGKMLFEGKTPYLHQSHPYILNLYPLLDGEVWGIVEDVIDQQRYINRLMSLLDYIIGISAKGLLMIPEGAIPDSSSPEEFADEYTKVGGVISSNSTSIGASEILGVQMQLVNELSGQNPAIQGQQGPAGTPASKYAMEAQNSAMNNRDLIDAFFSWIQRRDNKILQTILQFYNEKVYLGIAGQSYAEEAKYYDPEAIKGITFMANVTQSNDTPVYRQMIDDTLIKLMELNAIDGRMFLENSSLPFADKILDSIAKREEEVKEKGGIDTLDPHNQASLPPEILQGLRQGN